MTGPVEVLESGPPMSPGRSRVLVAVAVLLALAVAGLWVRHWASDRAVRRTVELTTTLTLVSSSTSPPGGSVRYFVSVRNDGPLPVTVTSVDGSSRGLRVRMGDRDAHPVPAGAEISIPLSALLTCADGLDAEAASLPAAIGVRRADGGTVTRRVRLAPAAVVVGVAATLCDVQPGLREHELSGPVVRSR